MALLKAPVTTIKDPTTFHTGQDVLLLLLVSFFVPDPLGIPVSAIAASGAGILFAVAKCEWVINTGKVLHDVPWRIAIFPPGMHLAVYGLRNAGLTDYLTTVLNMLAECGLQVATLDTGILSALLSSIMNNVFSVLVGAPSIDGNAATGTIKEVIIYASAIDCGLGPKVMPIGSLVTLLWLRMLAQKHITIGWGYYFHCGIIMTLPVLLVMLVALVLHLSFNQPWERTISITIYHNPDYGTSHNTLTLIHNSDAESIIVCCLGTPPSCDELRQLIAVMAISVCALLRKDVEPYDVPGLAEDWFTDDQLIDFILQHPILINRPTVTTPRGTRPCHSSEMVLEILTTLQKSAFVKEDGEPVIDAVRQRVK